MREYRIGEFAKYLGVTPDFLKHYEDQGIIKPSRSESGYRYYPFNTTMLLIECIRLRNYGMTLRELREILSVHKSDNSTVCSRISDNMASLEEEILLDQALTDDYRRFLEWKAPLEKKDFDWDIRWSKPMVFLPHTDKFDFLQDDRIYEILKYWMSYIPLVKSSAKIDKSGKITWGLLAEKDIISRLHIPMNDIVEHISSHKVFYYKFRSHILKAEEESASSLSHPAFRKLAEMNLKSGSAYFRTTLMPADWQQDIYYQYGYYAIPILED